MDRQLVAIFRRLHEAIYIGEIQLWIDTLGEEIQAKGDKINIACPLTIAEQRSLYPLGTSHHRQFRRRYPGAPIIMRMNTENDRLPPGEMPVHPFNLVSVDVRSRHLHCRRQIDNDRLFRCRLPDIQHRLTNFQCVLQLGAGKALR